MLKEFFLAVRQLYWWQWQRQIQRQRRRHLENTLKRATQDICVLWDFWSKWWWPDHQKDNDEDKYKNKDKDKDQCSQNTQKLRNWGKTGEKISHFQEKLSLWWAPGVWSRIRLCKLGYSGITPFGSLESKVARKGNSIKLVQPDSTMTS